MQHRSVQKQRVDSRDGVALIFAISLLMIFSVLGAGYVTFMTIELDEANYTVHETRSRVLAKAGANIAAGRLQDALASGTVEDVLGNMTLDLPTYDLMQGDEFTQRDDRTARVEIRIADESGKVNLNHAPASVLRHVLGVEGATARAISGHPRSGEGSWFVGVEDLRDLNLLTAEEFAAVDRSLVTTLTVVDHDSPAGYLNINSASAEVLAAVLGITRESAEQVRVQRPFTDLASLAEASGKDPATFNLKPAADGALPVALATESRCFRIGVKSNYSRADGSMTVSSHLDAVILFDGDGGYEFIHWQADAIQPLSEEELFDTDVSDAA